MPKNLSSHKFKEIYKDLDINLDKLGCVMLDVDGKKIPQMPEFEKEDWLYFAKDKKRFWINGFVAEKTAHVTLLYGLLEPATEWEDYIIELLKDWSFPALKIKDVSFFPSPYPEGEDPYYCIVAEIEVTDELLEGHQRLEFLPHINTFPGFKAHLTIAYVKKDEEIRDKVIEFYKEKLVGKEFDIIEVNLGGEKEEGEKPTEENKKSLKNLIKYSKGERS